MSSDGAPAREADLYWLRAAIDLSRSCPPAHTAFSVGALLVDAEGNVLSDGYSRQDDPSDHAEEAALRQIDATDPRLSSATIYSSLEPCGQRASRPRTCTELILDTPVPRVVFAWREPAVFVTGTGAQRLRAAGRTVVECPELAPLVRDVNAHVL
ncbi:diaminohydroxyphosphoribosylaminopyrimidine deaminase [Haloactinospora alba]|uniref:Diaminohydroxyphosphoribosylaminopyrimidine deaminase n=1 Tax=Haloactinospora alba TaxID=405555 RepID=A0A543NHA6_9ACTN|nr:dCMP deaminase [Haloactinospora alba]TQN31140.1 diaminohydroxyphosphoribosylaminopyrimidine deaminase [Haloactinospora alba]